MLAVLAAGCLLVAACSGDAGTATDPPSDASSTSAPSATVASSTLTVVGSIVLIGPYSASRTSDAGETCYGTGGFTDLTVGARITVTDASDTTVGVGTVDSAVVVVRTDTALRTCRFSFAVDDVPRGSASYSVKIARRDGPAYTEDELSRPIVLTLGNT